MFSNKFNAQYGGCYAISNGNYVTFRCQYWIQVFKVLLNPSRVFLFSFIWGMTLPTT